MELLITIAIIAFIIYAATNKKKPVNNTPQIIKKRSKALSNDTASLPKQTFTKNENKEEQGSYLAVSETTKINNLTERTSAVDESLIDVTDKFKRVEDLALPTTLVDITSTESEEKLPEETLMKKVYLEESSSMLSEVELINVNTNTENLTPIDNALKDNGEKDLTIDEIEKVITRRDPALGEIDEDLNDQDAQRALRQKEMINIVLTGLKSSKAHNNVSFPLVDASIVDVTDKYKRIDEIAKNKTEPNVPHWPFKYIYSCKEIEDTTPDQQAFYKLFKENFLNGIFNDLKGNTNYAFVLLYDLLEAYKIHKDIPSLKAQYDQLMIAYPLTKPYAINFLIKRMEEKGDTYGITTIKREHKYFYPGYENEVNNYWGLGTRYKEKLLLGEPMVKILNNLYYGSNNFYNIEFCRDQIVKTFVNLVALLDNEYKKEGTSREAVFLTVTDIIAVKHFKYKRNSGNYKYTLVNANNELFVHLLKHCENGVREAYGHKRKINVELPYTHAEITTVLEEKMLSKVKILLPESLTKIALPDEATDIELYAQNTARWKIKYESVENAYSGNSENFMSEIMALGKLNKNNPSCENIFFEASKFMSKRHKPTALALYLHYMYHDLKSEKFDNKPLTKSIQKSLFTTNEQLHEFEIILSRLIQDKNLEKALAQLPAVYEIKRKRIQLDAGSIKEVQSLHSDTVTLLNEYLKDELEDDNSTIIAEEINTEEVSIQITPKVPVQETESLYVAELLFTDIQIIALSFFEKSNFSIGLDEMENFAKAKGVFRNQLIESINESCYELLDDLLIEEEEDFYTINIDYYKSIKRDDE